MPLIDETIISNSHKLKNKCEVMNTPLQSDSSNLQFWQITPTVSRKNRCRISIEEGEIFTLIENSQPWLITILRVTRYAILQFPNLRVSGPNIVNSRNRTILYHYFGRESKTLQLFDILFLHVSSPNIVEKLFQW